MAGKTVISKPRILVCQHGARHRYAIASMLEQSDMLAALYTDSLEYTPLGRAGRMLGRRAPVSLQRLAQRRPTGIPRKKIRATDAYHRREFVQAVTGKRPAGIDLYRARHSVLSKKMKAWGLADADAVYSMYYENIDFLRWAVGQGVKSVVDVYIHPLTDDIMTKEREAYPEWSSGFSDRTSSIKRALWEETASMADLLLCPSEWVADGVRSTVAAAGSRIRIVPYGCSIDYRGRVNTPCPGRVLFAGNDALRKGLHYLAMAADQIRAEVPELDLRVAGHFPETIRTHPLCRNLNFLGSLSRERMEEEYLSADFFVLPSLSEGFAGVAAEAISAGCPVVITRESGSPVEHEREGLIVAARDADALASAMLRMLNDRALRTHCSEACVKEAPFYTREAWRKRLTAELETL